MKTIVLDTNVILSEPVVLAKKTHDLTLVIPFPVLTELAFHSFTRDDAASINNLVHEAVEKKHVIVHKLQDPAGIPTQPHLCGTDYDIIAAAQELLAQGADVRLATQDAAIARAAGALGIATIGLEELRRLSAQPTETNSVMAQRARGILSAQVRHMIAGVAIGIVSSIIASLIWANIGTILASLPVWGTVIAVVALGIVLYAARGRFRLTYGVLEFCFGIIIAVRVFWPDFDYSTFAPSNFLQVLAGVYVMVRGQDNVGKALHSTRFAPLWKKLSGNQ